MKADIEQSRSKCLAEIATLEVWIAANPTHPERIGAFIGWCDWTAELAILRHADSPKERTK